MDSFEIERYELVKEKMVSELSGKIELSDEIVAYFCCQMKFMLTIMDVYEDVNVHGIQNISVSKLIEYNKSLYSDIIINNYDYSYCNPSRSVEIFGENLGRVLSVVAYELRSCIPFAYENNGSYILIHTEFLMELLGIFKDLWNEKEESISTDLTDALYWFVSDYYDIVSEQRVAEMVDSGKDFAKKIICNNDLNNTDYLYRYGEYISDNEIKLSQYMSGLSEDKIDRIAKTFSEGYRIGFVTTGKDLSKKKTVNIRYPLGMERVIKKSIEYFNAMGLEPVIYRAYGSLFRKQNVSKVGFFGANPNIQFDYDHLFDEALILDGQLVTRKIECLKNAFEEYKEMAAVHAGPAVIEIFGENPFVPSDKEANLKLSDSQKNLSVKAAALSGNLTNEYIKGEERSFTIIAFPSPAIGVQFEEIFDETLEINTLDYYLYRELQQKIIDALDKADYVHIKGAGNNKTDLWVRLIGVTDPSKQTKFENCVADVNIPVGEVFTSPVLKGTEGVLNVSRVFLNELEYRNLNVVFKDGMVTEYECTNYEDSAKNKNYFKENVLFNHETLPIGEFAIGTNTRAYSFGKKYKIEDKLPILIAEKTGPHFALGDTCYSHAEDIAVYNSDGKEIMARDNEISIERKNGSDKAYFNCHTDITLPYDEVGLIEAVGDNGKRVEIIRNGKFVLPGLDELNKYL